MLRDRNSLVCAPFCDTTELVVRVGRNPEIERVEWDMNILRMLRVCFRGSLTKTDGRGGSTQVRWFSIG